ncbi:hypothetical protein M885DRAFT_536810 [Pelagophyceae sp. CCMP2097]|nr:hypothetical protein M885DRAFT_536810 [Pelagophyceae sp. CCMP2097]
MWVRNVFERGNALIERIGDVVAPVQSPIQELHIAIRRHDWARSLELLTQNYCDAASLNATGGAGGFDVTPLHVACEADFFECAEYLVNEGADVDALDKRAGETPLHRGARNGHVRVCRFLVDRGAAVAKRNSRGQTPYEVATDLNVRQWLLPLQLRAEAEDHHLAPGQPPPQNYGFQLQQFSQPQQYAPPAPQMGVAPPRMGGAPPQMQPTAFAPPMAPPQPFAPQAPAAQPMVVQSLGAAPPAAAPAAARGLSSPKRPFAPFQPTTAPLSASSSAAGGAPPATPDEQSPKTPAAMIRPASAASFRPPQSLSPPPPAMPAMAPPAPVSASALPAPVSASAPPPPVSASAPPPPVSASATAADGRHSYASKRTDAYGRYADGFHSSSSDPALAAKYGHIKADYSHLPPPPTMASMGGPAAASAMAPPMPPPPAGGPPQFVQVAPQQLGARYVNYNPTQGIHSMAVGGAAPPPPFAPQAPAQPYTTFTPRPGA